MKAVYIAAGFATVGVFLWIAIILVNGMRKRIETVNQRRRNRIEKERNRNGYQ